MLEASALDESLAEVVRRNAFVTDADVVEAGVGFDGDSLRNDQCVTRPNDADPMPKSQVRLRKTNGVKRSVRLEQG